MNSTKAKTKPTTSSLRSYDSSTSLGTKTDQTQTAEAQQNKNNNNGVHEAGPARYLYYERKGPGNPDAQPKPKSKLSKFLSKFQSPAVKQTNAARERERLEEERTGVKVYTALGTPGSTNQSTAAYM